MYCTRTVYVYTLDRESNFYVRASEKVEERVGYSYNNFFQSRVPAKKGGGGDEVSRWNIFLPS
jgi:hypothetical protein